MQTPIDPKTNMWSVMPKSLKFFLISETLYIGYNMYYNDMEWSDIPKKLGIDYGIHQVAMMLANL